MRTIVYIDGFNLYHGMRDGGLRDCYWLDVREMAVRLVRKPFVLENTKYFTARAAGARDGDSTERAAEREASRVRQLTYLEALDTIRSLEIYEGRFLMKREKCRLCKKEYIRPEEKATDVQIATELMTDAFLDRFDSAIIVSADADLVPPIKALMRHFPYKSVAIAFPPNRGSLELAQLIGKQKTMRVWPRTLAHCQMPEIVLKQDGTQLRRPLEWQ